ncbi:MAG: caspase family protein [Alphaproteobacteria bacterium]|nr:caspase family protein [Alphaproteobacteria bacterium]
MIGIDNYTAGWPRLSMAVQDAKLIAAELKKRGFTVTLRLNLNAEELETAFETFFVIRGSDPNARLFVWYAGHGHTLNGEGYLVPADAPRPDAQTQFKLKALPMRSLGNFVRLAESKHAFAVFDSCFSGTIFDSQRALPPAAITLATTRPVRQFLTSGDAEQTVSDDGTFRELFIRALRREETADANRDGYLTATELGLFMADRVTNLTQARQTPLYGKLRDKDYDRGDFVFALAPPPKPDDIGSRTRRDAKAKSAEHLFWESIQDSEDPAMFDAYLAQYPNGSFMAIARLRRDKLRSGNNESSGTGAGSGQSQQHRRRLTSPEDVTWRSIQFSADVEDFKAYLERYPNGKYAGDAHRIMKKLARGRTGKR